MIEMIDNIKSKNKIFNIASKKVRFDGLLNLTQKYLKQEDKRKLSL